MARMNSVIERFFNAGINVGLPLLKWLCSDLVVSGGGSVDVELFHIYYVDCCCSCYWGHRCDHGRSAPH